MGPDREASAIDCFLHHKAMVKSKHVKAKRDARSSGRLSVRVRPFDRSVEVFSSLSV